MLVTMTATCAPATDLGYLLHKHPDRAQSFDLSVGTAHVFYPEADEHRCTAALLLQVDTIAQARGRHRGRKDDFALAQYVNDRPYAASSMLAVALGRVFRTAMSGRCDARPELAASALPLAVRVPALPCDGDPELASRLFEPLGWSVSAEPVPLDPEFPEWGDSRYVDLRLAGKVRLCEALNQLYVLLPALDGSKHYWVSTDEIDKLVRAGAGWLARHPESELISRRYLARRADMTATALARLAEIDDSEPETLEPSPDEEPEAPEQAVSFAEQRRGAVLAVLRSSGAGRVADLGCGEGTLVAEMLAEPGFTEVVAADVSASALARAARRLKLDDMPERQRQRVRLLQSSLTYSDARLAGLDAVVLMEVIEHVDPPRLPALVRSVFGTAAPETVVMTTPNAEYNVRFERLDPAAMRHPDHRFEWTREQFRDWADDVAADWGYAVRFLPVGTDDVEVGPPTQLAVFTREARR